MSKLKFGFEYTQLKEVVITMSTISSGFNFQHIYNLVVVVQKRL